MDSRFIQLDVDEHGWAESRVGGKALNLWRLRAARVEVPRFFVITTDAFGLVEPLLREHYAQASFDTRTPTPAALGSLKDLDNRLAPLMREVCSAWSVISNDTGRLAVRSSAVGEDSAAVSYAGQYATLLGVSLEGAQQALWKCWFSTCERGLIEYRRIRQQASLPRMAVICQLMVEAAKSGVAVSRLTREGRPEALITAAYGLGVGVVSGEAITDTFCVDLDSGRVRQRIAKKDFAYRLSSGDNAVRAERVAERDSLEPVLDRRDLARLCDALPRIETVFGGPQDIEFAVDTGGKLRILQSRAITAELPVSVHRLMLDDSNITESFPGITSPLTFSFAQALYRDVFVGLVEALASTTDSAAPSRAAAAHLLVSCQGKIYYNVDAWHRLLSCVPFQRVVRTAWDDAVGVHKSGVHVAFTLVKHTARQALDAVRFVRFALGRHRHVKRAMRTFDRLYERLHSIDWRAVSPYDLRCEYELARELTRQCWIDAMRSDLLGAVYTSLLRSILSRDR
ncbi:MAG TPA: PEP/pyruvate-binding domain-containing protein, partial [Steroidobacteraceae bacterium]